MRKNINQETIEGRIYEHDLSVKTVQNQSSKNYGTEFINGSISVATDEAGLNVLTVHYTYVTETTSTGKTNATYGVLKRIIETGKTWVNDGKDAATKVRLNPSAALNDFYPQGQDQLVSQQRNEGGFATIITDLNESEIDRNKFKFDTIITGVDHIEADPEKNIAEDFVRIHCAIFNFRGDILPYTLVARSAGAMNYFESLEASKSNPIYTQVAGRIVSTAVKVQTTKESAFGEPVVEIAERRQREWLVTWAMPEPYLFDDESTITVKELSDAIANRNIRLEEVKTRAKEYYANQGNAAAPKAAPTPAPSAQVPQGGFNF